MMAASEARTAYQLVANHCLFQEDAKKAPKLACHPSSSSKQQPDSSDEDAAHGTNQSASSLLPFKRQPMNSNIPPDTKWWLQRQPNFVYPKDAICEQLSALEKFEDDAILTSKLLEDATTIAATCVDSEKTSSCLDAPWKSPSNSVKQEAEARTKDLNAVNNNFQRQIKQRADLCEEWYQNEDLVDWKTVDQLLSKKPEKACFALETPCIGSEKTEPSWRTADKDELASLVAQKSLQHIENCDLPPPQKVHICRDPFGCLDSFDDHRSFALSLDHMLHARTCCTLDYVNQSPTSGSMEGKHQTSEESCSVHDSERTDSNLLKDCMCSKDPPESKHHPDCDSSKAELLEALCHSQTRAREAEMAAQHAYNEKEHIVKLFFRQASLLFAYKQWIQMLQLESLFLQLKIKEHQIYSMFPVLPWTPLKGSHFVSGGSKAKKSIGQKHRNCSICRYALAFAVGFGLAGAGLLLGWTLAGYYPPFNYNLATYKKKIVTHAATLVHAVQQSKCHLLR